MRSACVVVAERDQVHPQLAHVAERHRRAEVGRRELSIQRGAPASTFGCVAACVVPSGVGGAGGGGDEAGGGAEVAAVVVAGFAFARAAGGFIPHAASSAMTGSGVMTVVGALPASPVCMELDSFTAMRTGTLCG